MKLAIFDLDHTLLPLDSDHAWGDYTVQLGWRDAEVFKAANDGFLEQYQEEKLDLDEYIAFSTAAFRERGAEQAYAARTQFVETVIKSAVRPEALDLVKQARQVADEVLLITATNAFVVEPIAPLFGIEHLLAVNLAQEEQDGVQWYNGKVEGVPSFREGKCKRLLAWLEARGKSWDDVTHSVFYSDSMNDLPLLEMVHEPVATNPDENLLKLAQDRGWEILHLWK